MLDNSVIREYKPHMVPSCRPPDFYPPIARPIFDWSEVDEEFPQAAPVMDGNLETSMFRKPASYYDVMLCFYF